MSYVIPLADLSGDGMNPPLLELDHLADFEPTTEQGASRYRTAPRECCYLDALLVNEATDVLIVTFHGALDRAAVQLPRFERIKSTREFGQSMMFFADPGMWADDELQLSWFAGWKSLDIFPLIADWSVKAAKAIGATRIIFTGSSGGGFAALQVSALVPGSVCLPFNPQTSVQGYLASGTSLASQRKFAQVFYPDASVDQSDWAEPYGAQLSPLVTYTTPRENHILYADNVNDFHHEQHLEPFAAVVRETRTGDGFRVYSYEGRPGHRPPSPDEFKAAMVEALAWCQELPPCL